MVNHDKPKVCQFELNTLKNINYYSWKPIKLQFKLSSKKYINLNKEALKTKKGVVWEGAYFKEGYPSLVNYEYDGKKKGIGKTLHIVENTFKELGYNFTWTILNTKEHGVPQNRERIYIVGFKNLKDFKKFKFQKPVELKTRLMDILEDKVDDKYLLSDNLVKCFNNHKKRHQERGNGFKFEPKKIDEINSVNCINTKYGSRATDTYLTLEKNEALSFAQRGRYVDNSEFHQ